MLQNFLTTKDLLLIATGLIIVIAVFVADRIVRRVISRHSKGLRLNNTSRTFSS